MKVINPISLKFWKIMTVAARVKIWESIFTFELQLINIPHVGLRKISEKYEEQKINITEWLQRLPNYVRTSDGCLQCNIQVKTVTKHERTNCLGVMQKLTCNI